MNVIMFCRFTSGILWSGAIEAWASAAANYRNAANHMKSVIAGIDPKNTQVKEIVTIGSLLDAQLPLDTLLFPARYNAMIAFVCPEKLWKIASKPLSLLDRAVSRSLISPSLSDIDLSTVGNPRVQIFSHLLAEQFVFELHGFGQHALMLMVPQTIVEPIVKLSVKATAVFSTNEIDPSGVKVINFKAIRDLQSGTIVDLRTGKVELGPSEKGSISIAIEFDVIDEAEASFYLFSLSRAYPLRPEFNSGS
jgi:hypothetical protein